MTTGWSGRTTIRAESLATASRLTAVPRSPAPPAAGAFAAGAVCSLLPTGLIIAARSNPAHPLPACRVEPAYATEVLPRLR